MWENSFEAMEKDGRLDDQAIFWRVLRHSRGMITIMAVEKEHIEMIILTVPFCMVLRRAVRELYQELYRCRSRSGFGRHEDDDDLLP